MNEKIYNVSITRAEGGYRLCLIPEEKGEVIRMSPIFFSKEDGDKIFQEELLALARSS